MYQSFEEADAPVASGERVKALQRELRSRRLKGFLVPHSDEHQDEFLSPSAERLAWLTGFTGSAGVAIVLDKAAALFVDGRYILQARTQVDQSLFEVLQTPDAKASTWLKEKLGKGAAVGYDPALHTIREIERLADTLGKNGIKLAAVDVNPIDLLWEERPKASTAPMRFAKLLEAEGAKFVASADPCILPKAIKNAVEIKGARAAHLRDGVAMARFLAWLDETGDSGRIDEVTAAIKLEESRRQSGQLKDISFDSISAAGPNGAVVHYRPTNASKQILKPGSLYLIDSGAQYLDGTTDVTRTLAIGTPTPEMKRHYGLVIKAHIAIATARFPKGTRGQDLDPFARRSLWEAGLDFDHGTGHGVGSFLSVHEGPQRLSRLGTAELETGMILSNEPGFYLEGQYGIRLETLVLVTPPEAIKGGSREMMGFETLTLVPFDRRLIDVKQLLPWELAWLNAYHARVRREIEPVLRSDDRAWLRHATAPIG
jgi:Xaa-Pro aminopeptidase